MGATRDNFIKYPRTPHLFGSRGTDDDKHLGRKESESFALECAGHRDCPSPGGLIVASLNSVNSFRKHSWER